MVSAILRDGARRAVRASRAASLAARLPKEAGMTEETKRGSVNEYVKRARELAPTLLQRIPETDKLRRLPDETVAAFKEAGFFRMLQPARWGGAEVDPKVF